MTRHEQLQREEGAPARLPVVARPARRVPFNLGGAGEVERAAGVEVEAEQGRLGVDREVAVGVEEVVARVIAVLPSGIRITDCSSLSR